MRFAFSFTSRACKAAFVSALALGAAAWSVSAQAADATGTATATVVRPIAIAATTDLRFGRFSTTASAQTITIAADDTRTSTGVKLVNASGPFGAAVFNVTGEGSLTYAITLPSIDVTISTAGGGAGKDLTVNNFTSDPSGTGTLSGGIGTSGAQTLKVGARLNTTSATQVTGDYTGTFTVTVEYN